MTNWASPTKWDSILTLLNQKRTDVEKSEIEHTFSGWIKQSDINTLRNGTIEILEDYGFTGLSDALNCAGYDYDSWKTWEQNWIADRSLDEIENILNLMQIETCTYQHLIVSDIYEVIININTYNFNFPGAVTYKNLTNEEQQFYPPLDGKLKINNTVTLQSIEDYCVSLGRSYGKFLSQEEITNRSAVFDIGYRGNFTFGNPANTNLLSGDWFKNQVEGKEITGGIVTFVAPLGQTAYTSSFDSHPAYIVMGVFASTFTGSYNVQFTYSYHTCV